MSDLYTLGLRHVALTVINIDACVAFYRDLVGMKIEWQPDKDNIYLTTGHDNLALHRAPENFNPDKNQRLDHLGFILPTLESVDTWYKKFEEAGVEIKAKPKTHRDGARSFYCADPDGNIVQMIFHPPLAKPA